MENSKDSIINQCINLGFNKEDVIFAFDKSENKSAECIIDWICNNSNLVEQNQKQNNIQENQNIQQKQNNENQQKVEEQPQVIYMERRAKIKIFHNNYKTWDFQKQYQKKVYFQHKINQLKMYQKFNKALKWIDEHNQDEDYNEELQIVEIKDDKPKLTPEEAKQQAKELQQRIRDANKIKEKELALQQERDRIKGGKLMTQAAREQEESQQKIIIMEKMRQKKEDELYKQKLIEKIENEKKERLGDKYRPPVKEQKTPLDNIKIGIKQLQIAHPSSSFPGMAKKALQTIQIYLSNILKNLDQEKFRKINTENQAFKDRVGQTVGGLYILQNSGFKQIDNFLVLEIVDEKFLNEVYSTIQGAVDKM